MKTIFPILFFGLCYACNTPTNKGKVSPISAQAVHDSFVLARQTVPAPGEQEGSIRFPPAATFGNLLLDGSFHGDEVDPASARLKYQGLFKSDSDYYFSPVKVKITQVQDAIWDEDDQVTGWAVEATPKKDSVIFLIAGMNHLNGHRFAPVQLPQDEVLPGQRIEFKFGGKEYALFATGKKVGSDFHGYKLYLSTKRGGRRIEELLVDIPQFEAAMVHILLAGDMDGDGELDLYLDATWNYNLTAPTLYLSKPAGEGHLLKAVARFNSVGC